MRAKKLKILCDSIDMCLLYVSYNQERLEVPPRDLLFRILLQQGKNGFFLSFSLFA